MKPERMIAILFFVAAAYDGVLGLAFLFFHDPLFHWWNVPLPNHRGYVDFPAALLLVFALMFLNIARRPRANRNLIPYGILLKIAYVAVVLGHWMRQGIPDLWKVPAVADLVFLILFAWAYSYLGRHANNAAA